MSVNTEDAPSIEQSVKNFKLKPLKLHSLLKLQTLGQTVFASHGSPHPANAATTQIAIILTERNAQFSAEIADFGQHVPQAWPVTRGRGLHIRIMLLHNSPTLSHC